MNDFESEDDEGNCLSIWTHRDGKLRLEYEDAENDHTSTWELSKSMTELFLKWKETN